MMLKPLTHLPQDGIVILYDGDCPFCTRYTQLLRLRSAAGTVHLIDARTRPDCIAELRAQGLDINDGMLVQTGGTAYFGGDALHILALMSVPSGFWNRLIAAVMRHPRLAATLYPALRTGRNLTLRLMNRPPIP